MNSFVIFSRLMSVFCEYFVSVCFSFLMPMFLILCLSFSPCANTSFPVPMLFFLFQPSFVRLLEEWDRKTLFESSTDKYAAYALSTGSGENTGGKNSSISSGSSSQVYTPTSLIASSYSTLPKGTTVCLNVKLLLYLISTIAMMYEDVYLGLIWFYFILFYFILFHLSQGSTALLITGSLVILSIKPLRQYLTSTFS